MADAIDWVVIEKFGRKIGAIGFIGDTASVVVAFYDDRDGDKNGKVSFGEWAANLVSPVKIKGAAVVEVAMQARVEPDVILRDPAFQIMAANLFTTFAAGLVKEGIYTAYFSFAVSSLAGSVAGRLASNMVASYAIKKGMEKAVKAAYDAAVR
jgi:hypothetical protein